MGKHESAKKLTGGGTASPKLRDSNIELFRIIVMLLIVAHHYVVNSGLTAGDGPIYSDPMSWRSIFLLLFGAWGKIGINCFVIITGYYMCMLHITVRKFVKLLSEVMFYTLLIHCLFWISGYARFSLMQLIDALIPVRIIKMGFTSAFLVYYLSIPFLNILVHAMDEKQHRYLLLLCGFVYVFLGTIPKIFEVRMNYFSWFIVIHFLASYIRLYPKPVYENRKLCCQAALTTFAACIASIVLCAWICARFNKRGAYLFVSDSNTFLAVAMGVSAFLMFKNLPIGYSRLINTIASSTFGVLLIHANSDTMRQWLWKDMLDNVGHYSVPWMPLHAIGSVLMIFIVCILIDQLRIRWIEKPFLTWWDKIIGARIRFNVVLHLVF